MHWLRIAFMITVLATTSGYRFRCYFACVDQTGIQNDYVEQRDRCREYAQLKVNMAMRESGGYPDEKSRKTHLVTLFSQCMSTNGWIVPDGRGEGPKGGAAAAAAAATAPISSAATAAPPSATQVAANKAEERAQMIRSSECAFARHQADVSSIARTRAHACDLECEEALRLSPGAPRPPSCPSDLSPRLSKGNEN